MNKRGFERILVAVMLVGICMFLMAVSIGEITGNVVSVSEEVAINSPSNGSDVIKGSTCSSTGCVEEPGMIDKVTEFLSELFDGE
jgi:hypothetical protein